MVSSTGYADSSTLPLVAPTEATSGEPDSNGTSERKRSFDCRICPLTEENLKKALSSLVKDNVHGLDKKAATRNAGSRCSSQMNSRQGSRDRRVSGVGSRCSSLGSRTGFDRSVRCPSKESLPRSELRSGIPVAAPERHPSIPRTLDPTRIAVDPATVAIVLDWDDTLCPTTWLREDCGVDWTVSLPEVADTTSERYQLIHRLVETHVKCVKEFLREASRHGTIILLTLAKRPWVEISLQNWMPDLLTTFEECSVCIVYAQDFINEADLAQVSSATPNLESDVEVRIWTQAKEKGVLDRLLNDSSVEWGHLLCIGDSEFERMGIRTASTKLKGSCFTKTLKLLEDPSIEELTAELRMLRVWLPFLIARMGDFDDQIDTPDDVNLQELHLEITGEPDETLSWEVLAGLTE